MFDLIGKDAVMFRYDSADTRGPGAPFVAQARQWLDSVWSQISWKASDLDVI